MLFRAGVSGTQLRPHTVKYLKDSSDAFHSALLNFHETEPLLDFVGMPFDPFSFENSGHRGHVIVLIDLLDITNFPEECFNGIRVEVFAVSRYDGPCDFVAKEYLFTIVSR